MYIVQVTLSWKNRQSVQHSANLFESSGRHCSDFFFQNWLLREAAIAWIFNITVNIANVDSEQLCIVCRLIHSECGDYMWSLASQVYFNSVAALPRMRSACCRVQGVIILLVMCVCIMSINESQPTIMKPYTLLQEYLNKTVNIAKLHPIINSIQ